MSSFELYKTGKPTIILLENCPCNSKDELMACERKHIQKIQLCQYANEKNPPYEKNPVYCWPRQSQRIRETIQGTT